MSTAGHTPQTPKENLRAIRVFCIAIIAGVTVFAGVMLGINSVSGPVMETTENPDTKNIFLAVCGILALACLYFANKHYNKKISEARSSGDTLMARLNVYRNALIRYMALCDFPAMFAIISYFTTGDLVLLLVVGVMLAAMFWKAPFGKKWITELNADWKDQEEILK